jgi:hypothetical protein
MPVAMIMTILLDLMESRGMERLEKDLAALPEKPVESQAQWDDAEPWDGLS